MPIETIWVIEIHAHYDLIVENQSNKYEIKINELSEAGLKSDHTSDEVGDV